MKKLLIIAAALCVTLPAAPALSQDAQPELRDVKWYQIHMIRWVSGKGARAHEIIEMFEKVDEALGEQGVLDFHMSTGEWNSIVAFPMKHGIAEMGWKESPEGKKWDAEFARQVGGEDKAKALMDELQTLVAAEQRHVGHIDIGE
ncbi:hypothetical protein [Allopontixanthobacter sp.]|uniref:hypothetical protein n=1 Tax=Allopontixanthobacter sp. TaxID=2906452 RepID=UPI002ABB93F3|nr:hypothetical protein [Allopontixanthobacter sp.]MDZ4307598.1 hypothetical protein [Allopontixanthobacter sp.]